MSYSNPFDERMQTRKPPNLAFGTTTSIWAGKSKAEVISGWAHEASRVATHTAFKRQKTGNAVHKSRRKPRISFREAGTSLTINTDLTMHRQQPAGFIDLASLQAADISETPVATGTWRTRAEQQRRQSVPSSPFIAQPIPVNERISHQGHHREDAPMIIITPAREHSGWSPLHPDFNLDRRREVESSYYSQALPMTAEKPGAPPLSSPVQGAHSHGTSKKYTNLQITAPTNSVPLMESELDHATSTIAEAGPRYPRRSSLDETSPSGQSYGWWNTILSPFLARSNTMRERSSAGVPDGTSAIVSPRSVADGRALTDEKTERFSPVSPESTKIRDSQTTTWSGLSEWEEDVKILEADTKSLSSLPQCLRAGAQGALPPPKISLDEIKTGSDTQRTRSLPPLHTDNGDNRPADHLGVQHTCPDVFSPSDREVPMLFKSGSLRGSRLYALFPPPPSSTGRRVKNNEVVTVHHANVITYSRPMAMPEPTHLTSSRQPSVTRTQSGAASSTGPPPYSPPRRHKALLHPSAQRPNRIPHAPSLRMSSSILLPDIVSSRAGHASNITSSNSRTDSPPRKLRHQVGTQEFDAAFRSESQGPTTITILRDVAAAKEAETAERRRKRAMRKRAVVQGSKDAWRGVRCLGYPKNHVDGTAARKQRRMCIGLIIAAIIMILVTILILVLTLVRRVHTTAAYPSPEFLNLTGFPPIPTGISTIIQPDMVVENTGCFLMPCSLWSCALAQEEQPNAFRPYNKPTLQFNIIFRNDSIATNTTGPLIRHLSARHLRRRDVSFEAIPPPPPIEELRFLGNTTENVSAALKEGEATPFYITFLSPPVPPPSVLSSYTASSASHSPTVSSLSANAKRHLPSWVRSHRQTKPRSSTASSRHLSYRGSSDTFPDVTALIPPPTFDPRPGHPLHPSPANLLPASNPISQPLRLYDRGLPTEHYAFYTYYDRSIFLQSSAPITGRLQYSFEHEMEGGSPLMNATTRCTWAQTRFLVQIWTRKQASSLIRNGTDIPGLVSKPSSQPDGNGNFKLPTTITIDRHGGDPSKKMLYCQRLDADSHDVVLDAGVTKVLQLENRGKGGVIINPAPFLTYGAQRPYSDAPYDPAAGGIDGGSGGCQCMWRNFVDQGLERKTEVVPPEFA